MANFLLRGRRPTRPIAVALLGAAMGGSIGVLTASRNAGATTCAVYAAVLELEKVEIDGQPAADLQAYDHSLVSLYGLAPGRVSLMVSAAAGWFSETYNAPMSSGK